MCFYIENENSNHENAWYFRSVQLTVLNRFGLDVAGLRTDASVAALETLNVQVKEKLFPNAPNLGGSTGQNIF